MKGTIERKLQLKLKAFERKLQRKVHWKLMKDLLQWKNLLHGKFWKLFCEGIGEGTKGLGKGFFQLKADAGNSSDYRCIKFVILI